MSRRGPVQLALFGPRYVHLGLGGYCVACRVLLSLADEWTCCGVCPGWVEPAPPWALLTAVEKPALELGEAA